MEHIINIITSFAFVLLTGGIVFQIMRVWKRRSSCDISIWEIYPRLLASGALFVKFAESGDITLVTGQIVFLIVYWVYSTLVIKYHWKPVII